MDVEHLKSKTDNVTYDVADATARAEINELKSKLEYTFIGEASGTNALNLPSDWKVLVLQVYYSSTSMTTYFINSMMTDTLNNYSFGNYGTSYAVGKISKTKAQISVVNWAGSDVTNNAKLYGYYR